MPATHSRLTCALAAGAERVLQPLQTRLFGFIWTIWVNSNIGAICRFVLKTCDLQCSACAAMCIYISNFTVLLPVTTQCTLVGSLCISFCRLLLCTSLGPQIGLESCVASGLNALVVLVHLCGDIDTCTVHVNVFVGFGWLHNQQAEPTKREPPSSSDTIKENRAHLAMRAVWHYNSCLFVRQLCECTCVVSLAHEYKAPAQCLSILFGSFSGWLHNRELESPLPLPNLYNLTQ